jgi:hypothetical protein
MLPAAIDCAEDSMVMTMASMAIGPYPCHRDARRVQDQAKTEQEPV